MSLPHTKGALRKHRGLMMIIAAMLVIAVLEPGLNIAARVCGELILVITEWRQP